MRAWVAIAASLLTVTGVPGAVPAAVDASPVYYLVRPDPRLCPSPICGGAWIRRVNHPLTRCVDGSMHPECYVASIAPSSAAHGDITRGRLVPAGISGFPGLGKLVVASAWMQMGEPARAAPVYRLVDTGVRCITTPCFSYRAALLERNSAVSLSDVDILSDLPPETLRRVLRAMSQGGILAAGVVKPVPRAGPAGAGRVLVVRQVWLRAPAAR